MKLRVHQALIAHMEARLQQMAAIAEDTRKGAVHEENRSEGDKDMRATEQSYIARGQAMRVDELAEELRRLVHTSPRGYQDHDSAGLYALVALVSSGARKRYYLTPFGGGNEVIVDGEKVMVLAPTSPLGERLMGLSVGDSIEFANREWSVSKLE